MNTDGNLAALREYEREVDNQDAADSAWANERIDLAETLKAGGTVYLNRKPYLTINDVFQQMCDDSMSDPDEDPIMCALKCCTFDNTGAGALLAQAMSTAVDHLLEVHEGPLRRQWEESPSEL